MKLFFIMAFALLGICAPAQKKVNFSSQNYVGLLEGEHGSSLQLQTINGVKFNRWFVGLGAGIDWYFRRSVPIFTSVTADFLKKEKRSFYFAANVGINFPWQIDDYHNEWGYIETKSSPGKCLYEATRAFKFLAKGPKMLINSPSRFGTVLTPYVHHQLIS